MAMRGRKEPEFFTDFLTFQELLYTVGKLAGMSVNEIHVDIQALIVGESTQDTI